VSDSSASAFKQRELKKTALSCVQHELDLPEGDDSVLKSFFIPAEPTVDDVRVVARTCARIAAAAIRAKVGWDPDAQRRVLQQLLEVITNGTQGLEDQADA
jgi:hypothetical protein